MASSAIYSNSSFSEMTFAVRLDSSLIFNQIINQLQLSLENYGERLEEQLTSWEGNYAIIEKQSGESFGDFSMKIKPISSNLQSRQEPQFCEKKDNDCLMRNTANNDDNDRCKNNPAQNIEDESGSFGLIMSPETQAEYCSRLPSVSEQSSKFRKPRKSYLNNMENSTSEMLNCNSCGFQAKTANCLVAHVRRNHFGADKQYCCHLCHFSTKFKHNLKLHYQRKHNLDSLDRDFFIEQSKRPNLKEKTDLLLWMRSENSDFSEDQTIPAEVDSTAQLEESESAVHEAENETLFKLPEFELPAAENETRLHSAEPNESGNAIESQLGEFSCDERNITGAKEMVREKSVGKRKQNSNDQASLNQNSLEEKGMQNSFTLESNLTANVKVEPDESFCEAENNFCNNSSASFLEESAENPNVPDLSRDHNGLYMGKTYHEVINASRKRVKAEIPTFDDESLDKGIAVRYYNGYVNSPETSNGTKKIKGFCLDKHRSENIGAHQINSAVEFSAANLGESEFDQSVCESSQNEVAKNFAEARLSDNCNLRKSSQEHNEEKIFTGARKRKSFLVSSVEATKKNSVADIKLPKAVRCRRCGYKTFHWANLYKHIKAEHWQQKSIFKKDTSVPRVSFLEDSTSSSAVCPFEVSNDGVPQETSTSSHGVPRSSEFKECSRSAVPTEINQVLSQADDYELVDDPDLDSANEEEIAQYLECYMCNFTTYKKSFLYEHMKAKHLVEGFHCSLCDYSTLPRSALFKHYLGRHGLDHKMTRELMSG